MEFIDLKSQQARIRKDIDANIAKVLDHGQYIMGPEIKELETQLAEYTGSKHCLTVANGTDALLIALMALGVKAGDEVITTPFTFIATGEMIALIGAKPVFVDIDEKTYNIDPKKIVAAITDRTKAIMPVSLYGQCADMDAINAIAAKHKLPVIEDAAQSFGAGYKGKKSCNLSTIGSTSFFPLNLSAATAMPVRSSPMMTSWQSKWGTFGCTDKTAATTTPSSGSMAAWIPCRQPSCYRSWLFFPKKSSCARKSVNATLSCSRRKASRRRLSNRIIPAFMRNTQFWLMIAKQYKRNCRKKYTHCSALSDSAQSAAGLCLPEPAKGKFSHL
jgi:hypothetical protein